MSGKCATCQGSDDVGSNNSGENDSSCIPDSWLFWGALILVVSHFGFAVSCVLGSCRAVLAALLCVELGVQGKGPKAIPCGILSCAGGEARLGSCAAL